VGERRMWTRRRRIRREALGGGGDMKRRRGVREKSHFIHKVWL